MSVNILVIGELNVDLILRGYTVFPAPGKEVLVDDLFLTLGSSSAICAVGLARLGDHVSFIGKTGVDPWGDFCVETLRREKVDTSLVNRDPGLKTGLTASITAATDRALVTYLGATADMEARDVPSGTFTGFRHVHVSSFYLQRGLRPGLRGLFEAAHAAGLTTSLDPGYDPTERWERDLLDVLPEVDVFLPSESELQAITGCDQPAAALDTLANGRTLTIGKLGMRGSVALREGHVVSVPAFPVDSVDTTGAGDSYNAGFLHAWLHGRPLEDCMKFGAACGALSTLGLGGISAQPSFDEATSFLETRDRDPRPK